MTCREWRRRILGGVSPRLGGIPTVFPQSLLALTSRRGRACDERSLALAAPPRIDDEPPDPRVVGGLIVPIRRLQFCAAVRARHSFRRSCVLGGRRGEGRKCSSTSNFISWRPRKINSGTGALSVSIGVRHAGTVAGETAARPASVRNAVTSVRPGVVRGTFTSSRPRRISASTVSVFGWSIHS